MRRIFPIALLVTLSMSGCQERPSPTSPAEGPLPTASPAISDGALDAEGNPHFFWLAPTVSQPDESLFGTSNLDARPEIRVVCLESNDPDVATCDPEDPVTNPTTGEAAVFSVGSGIVVDGDHFKLEFDTKAFALEPTAADRSVFTTYRVLALTPPLGGVQAAFGFADVQVGEGGKDAKSLTEEGATIGLKDGRTLPVNFRVDRGAIEFALETQTGGEEQALCQINCSITVIEPDEQTEAFLEDPDNPGFDLTAILFESGDVDETSVLLIDERATDDGNCAPGIGLEKEDCFRYEISPDEPFNNPVRMGICPLNVPTDDAWRILKADDGVLSRPPGAFVDDFLDCSIPGQPMALWDGVGGELAARTLRWLVAPLWARDRWGASINDLSDLFWGRDAVMSAVSEDGTAAVGAAVPITVEVVAPHDADRPLAGIPVSFEVTGGGGTLDDGQTSTTTIATDAAGLATVDWTVGLGTNTLEVTSPEAVGGPLTFTVEGIADAVTQADVVAAFTRAFDDYVLYSGLLTDEFVHSGSETDREEVDERDVTGSNVLVGAEVFVPLDSARRKADQLAGSVDQADVMLGKYYGGVSRLLMAELFCQTSLDGGAAASSDVRMTEALSLLEEAETVAASFGSVGIENAANVGQARAHIWLEDYASAIASAQEAQPSPGSFETSLPYDTDEISAAPRNGVFDFTVTDPRWTVGDGSVSMPHEELWLHFADWDGLGLVEAFGTTGQDGTTPVNRQLRYTSAGDDILLASSFEARMIEAEAYIAQNDLASAEALINDALTGNNPQGLTLSAVNVGTATEAREELARARSLGLWLTGNRQGVLRRYVEQWALDLYPDGTRGTAVSLPPDGSITCP